MIPDVNPRQTLTAPDWTFGGSWPYEPRSFEYGGVRLHYVDEGSGEPVVMLHGNPTWGYVYRRFVARLAASRRCVVPDHMGFGRSEKPLDGGQYTLGRHVENLSALLLELDLHDVTLVMQDWGGPIGFGFAVEHPERVKRLVILNTWAFLYPEGTTLHGLLELFRQPHVGEAMVQALNLFVEGYLPGGIHHKERLPEIMPAYRAPFPDYNSRVGTLAFPRDIPVGGGHPSAPTMRRIEENLRRLYVPTVLIWGMRDPDFEPSVVEEWTEVYPHAEVHRIDTAGHFSQEDEPERIVGIIQDFLGRYP